MKTKEASKKKNREYIRLFLTSIMIVFALTARWDLLYETRMTNPIAELFNRFAYSFNFSGYSDILVFIGVVFLIKKIRDEEKSIHSFTLIVAASLAFTYICSFSFMLYASMLMINRDFYQILYCICLWIGATLLIYYLIRSCSLLVSHADFLEADSEVIDANFWNKHIFSVSFIIVVVLWLCWLICIYPGTCNPDAVAQLSQYFSGDTSKWTTHHPPFSTLIMGTLVRTGQMLFKSADFGFFMYLLLQTVTGALIVAYGVITLKQHFGLKNKWLIVIDLFFGIVPFWGVYASMFEKSLLYSEFATLVTILVLPVVKYKEISNKRAIGLCLVCILTALLRNNGIYAIVPLLVVLAIYLKDINRKKILVVLTLLLVTYHCVNNVIYPSLGIQKGSIAEALSLPFQQTAKYVKFYSDEITAKEKEAIDSVLAYDELAERYNPIISNPVKETYKGDNSKLGAYMCTWLKMFFKHPGIYFSAFMDSSYGYIAPINQSIETTTNYDYVASGLQNFGLTNQAHYGGVELTNALRNMSLTLPLLKYLCMPGLYTWIMVLAILILLRRKKYETMIMFIPSIMNVLVCLASPLSTSMRYAQPTVATVPFLVLLAIHYSQTIYNGDKK